MGRKRAMKVGRDGARSDAKRDERPVVEVTQGSAFRLAEFRRVATSGAFRRIVIESDWTHFWVKGEFPGGGYANLSKTRLREVRKFLNPAAALLLLRRMGVVRVEIEMRDWDVEMASLAMRMRPDVTARRLRRQRTAGEELMREAAKLYPELLTELPKGSENAAEAAKASREEELSRMRKRRKLQKEDEERIAAADARWAGAGPAKVDVDKLNRDFDREFYAYKGWPAPS